MTRADAVVVEHSDVTKPRPVPVRRSMMQEVAVSAAKSDVEEIAIPVPQVQMIVMPSPVPQVMMQGVMDIPEVKQRWVSTGVQTTRKTEQTVECPGLFSRADTETRRRKNFVAGTRQLFRDEWQRVMLEQCGSPSSKPHRQAERRS